MHRVESQGDTDALRSAICIYLIAERRDGATIGDLAQLSLDGHAPTEEVARVSRAVSGLVQAGKVTVEGGIVRPVRSVLDQCLAKGSVIALARHTVERYRERFEPNCDFTNAKRRLYARMHRGSYTPERPDWLVHVPKVKDPGLRHNIGYLVVDDEIVLPLRKSMARVLPGRFPPQPLTAVTCLYRI